MSPRLFKAAYGGKYAYDLIEEDDFDKAWGRFLAGYDGINLARVVSPRLTTWQQNTEELGRTAAARLIERIEHPRTALPEHLVIRGSLFEGESVRQL